MRIPSGFLPHLLFFIVLGLAVSAVVSGYRDDEPRKILRGTLRRMVKFSGFSLILAFGMLLFEWILFRWVS